MSASLLNSLNITQRPKTKSAPIRCKRKKSVGKKLIHSIGNGTAFYRR